MKQNERVRRAIIELEAAATALATFKAHGWKLNEEVRLKKELVAARRRLFQLTDNLLAHYDSSRTRPKSDDASAMLSVSKYLDEEVEDARAVEPE